MSQTSLRSSQRHDEEMVGISDSKSIEKMINSDDIFDYEAAARALRANHDRDMKKNGEVRDQERRRQEEALKEKLRARRAKKKKGTGSSSSDDDDEAAALSVLKDQWLLEDYVENGVNRGVVRVLKTRGGTRTLTEEVRSGDERSEEFTGILTSIKPPFSRLASLVAGGGRRRRRRCLGRPLRRRGRRRGRGQGRRRGVQGRRRRGRRVRRRC